MDGFALFDTWRSVAIENIGLINISHCWVPETMTGPRKLEPNPRHDNKLSDDCLQTYW
jgi:hypothetical protein